MNLNFLRSYLCVGVSLLLTIEVAQSKKAKPKSTTIKVPQAPEFNLPKSWSVQLNSLSSSSDTKSTSPVVQKSTRPQTRARLPPKIRRKPPPNPIPPKIFRKPPPRPIPPKPVPLRRKPAPGPRVVSVVVPKCGFGKPCEKSPQPRLVKPVVNLPKCVIRKLCTKNTAPKMIVAVKRVSPKPRCIIRKQCGNSAAAPVARVVVKAFRNGNKPALRKFHQMADKNGDGKLTGLELLQFAANNFARYLNRLKVKKAVKSADTNQDGELSVEELIIAVRRQMLRNHGRPIQVKHSPPIIVARRIQPCTKPSCGK